MKKLTIKSLPFTIGIFFTVAFVFLLHEFIRGFDYKDVEYTMEMLPYLGMSFACALVGIPSVIYGINRLSDGAS
ncbi:hypothetical protein ACJJIE_04500 [Microbulbifer sp. TRSA001]|uniref:hypothetical protein n=1 Tax=Microbulbifer sp. TRSA001 TaxID=3243381 RepID=UPI00403A7A0E